MHRHWKTNLRTRYFPALVHVCFWALLALSCRSARGYRQLPGTPLGAAQILSAELGAELNLRTYDTGMKVGDSFLLPVSPGIPFREDELSFVTRDSSFRLPAEMNKVYSFSKLVDIVVPYSQFTATSLPVGTGLDIISRAQEAGLLDGSPVDLQILTNALYNDQFFYTYVNPRISELTWTTVKIDRYGTGSFQRGGQTVRYSYKKYELQASMTVLNIERPWLNLDYGAADDRRPVSSLDRFAIVKQLVLLRKLRYRSFAAAPVAVSRRGKLIRPAEPTFSLGADSAIVVGARCVIL